MTSDSEHPGFKKAEEHRCRLRGIIADVIAVADGLKAASAPRMRKIDERVASEAFRVMVVGEFKRGKSTLINAMLGGDILPAYARPATAVLTELRWSQSPTAVLHPADGGEAVEVEVADLTKQITIPKGVRQGDADTSPWKLAEVGWPLDMLKNGVVLIDSPGLNEHPVRQEVTLEHLSRADAIVFVQDCQHPVAMEEVRFMDTYLDAYDVFFVFNKINFIPPGEVAEVKEETLFRVRQHRDGQRHDRYFFVNALAALQSRINGDGADWRGSGVAGFVDDLSVFLATERHRAKLIGPAREVSSEIRQLRREVPQQRALIEQNEADLRRRYDEAQDPLRRLQTRAGQMRQELEQAQEGVESVVRAEVANRLVRMSTEMPEIVAAIMPEAELSLAPWKVKAAAEAYAKELAQRASTETASRFKTWQKEQLKAVLEPSLTSMAQRADELFRDFMRDLAKVREGLTGLDPSTVGSLAGPDGETSLADADLAGMNFTGGAAIGHLVGQIAAAYGVALIWAFTPFGFIPLIIGVMITNAAVLNFAKGKMEQKVRREIAVALAGKMREDAATNGAKSAREFRKALSGAVSELMSRVDNELTQLQVQVEDALDALSMGEDAVKQRRKELAAWESQLEKSADAIEDLISDVAMT